MRETEMFFGRPVVAVQEPFDGKVPTNKVCLWVFKAQNSDDWFVELESEDKATVLRSFRCDSVVKGQAKANAVWFGKLTAEILGVELVECGPRGQ